MLIGLGMAAAIRPNLRRKATAKVRMDENRRVTVEMDMTDIGTGSYTIFAQVAAETLGLPIEQVTVKLGHSSYPDTPGSGGSFGASSCGAALHDACRRLKARLDVGKGAQGLTATGKVQPGDEYKKYSQFAYGAHFEMQYRRGTMVVYNDPKLVEESLPSIRRAVGATERRRTP